MAGTGTKPFQQASTLKLAGAEISAFDPRSSRLFVTSFGGLQVVSVSANLSMTLVGKVSLGSNDINSVAVKNGMVAVAVAASDKTQPGSVYLLDGGATLSVTEGVISPTGFVVGNVTVGALPDMLVFTDDGRKVLVANEGEQDTAGRNPEGSVSIIDLSPVLATNAGADAVPTVTTASFAAFNSQRDALKAKGVRLFAGEAGYTNVTVAQDLEPEYIAISPDGSKAFVTLQENNAIGILDLGTGEFTDIVPLGLKAFGTLLLDTNDRDNAAVLKTGLPVYGLYMPDAIASFVGADGLSYYVIANEGDDRDDFINPDETIRVSSSSYVLDPTVFPNASLLKTDGMLGRLTVSNAPGNRGDVDGDGDIDKIITYGGRSFSILNDQGQIIYDSGSQLEEYFARGGLFNSGNPAGSGLFDDTRSDNKGPEPEGVTVGQVGSRTLAFVGIERGGGGVMVYDITDPRKVSLVQHLRNAADVSPEGVTFVAAAHSPSGRDLLFVTNEVSMSVTAFENAQVAHQQLHHQGGSEPGLLQLHSLYAADACVDDDECLSPCGSNASNTLCNVGYKKTAECVNT
jgi:DNA-binding beta-propeller fold protein YncE